MTIPFYEFFCLNRKYVLLNFLSRNLKLKYRRSAFGYLWTLLIPLAQVGIFFFVYRVILNVQIPNYLSFIISGILPWVFFVSSVTESLDSLVAGHQLLNHAPVPIQIFPAAATITHFINLLPSIPLILLITWFDTQQGPSWSWLLVVPLSIALFVFTYSLSFLLACLFVYLRDLKYMIAIVVQLWMYITPVLYRENMVPEKFRWVTWVNPLSGFFISLRKAIFEHSLPDPGPLSVFLIWTLGLLLMAEWVRRVSHSRIVEKL